MSAYERNLLPAEMLQRCRYYLLASVSRRVFREPVVSFTCVCNFHPACVGSGIVLVLRDVLKRYRYELVHLFKAKTTIRIAWINAAAQLVHRLRALRPEGEESVDGRR